MSDLAERLCRARLEGGTVPIGPAEIGENLDAAYALQQEVLRQIGDPSDRSCSSQQLLNSRVRPMVRQTLASSFRSCSFFYPSSAPLYVTDISCENADHHGAA